MASAGRQRYLVVYRVSSGGYRKEKPAYITKKSCFVNFVRAYNEFQRADPSSVCELRIIADNCTPELLEFVNRGKPPGTTVTETDHKNGAASFRDALDMATAEGVHDDCRVYFVEDDYLHTEGALEAIFEGLNVADFSTGYDHPDKYSAGTPLVANGAEEGSAVFLGKSGHFRATNSTTMTFAAKASTLRRCKPVMSRWVSGTHPHDFYMFLDLAACKQTRLVCTLPARSTHGETAFLAPHPFGGKPWEVIGRECVSRSR